MHAVGGAAAARCLEPSFSRTPALNIGTPRSNRARTSSTLIGGRWRSAACSRRTRMICSGLASSSPQRNSSRRRDVPVLLVIPHGPDETLVAAHHRLWEGPLHQSPPRRVRAEGRMPRAAPGHGREAAGTTRGRGWRAYLLKGRPCSTTPTPHRSTSTRNSQDRGPHPRCSQMRSRNRRAPPSVTACRHPLG